HAPAAGRPAAAPRPTPTPLAPPAPAPPRHAPAASDRSPGPGCQRALLRPRLSASAPQAPAVSERSPDQGDEGVGPVVDVVARDAPDHVPGLFPSRLLAHVLLAELMGLRSVDLDDEAVPDQVRLLAGDPD